jgi:hypothetical protein
VYKQERSSRHGRQSTCVCPPLLVNSQVLGRLQAILSTLANTPNQLKGLQIPFAKGELQTTASGLYGNVKPGYLHNVSYVLLPLGASAATGRPPLSMCSLAKALRLICHLTFHALDTDVASTKLGIQESCTKP